MPGTWGPWESVGRRANPSWPDDEMTVQKVAFRVTECFAGSAQGMKFADGPLFSLERETLEPMAGRNFLTGYAR